MLIGKKIVDITDEQVYDVEDLKGEVKQQGTVAISCKTEEDGDTSPWGLFSNERVEDDARDDYGDDQD